MVAVLAIALSLVANWVASENITGLTGEVACSNVLPAVLLDPLGASACLFILGFILSPHVGQHETMSDVMIQRFGNTVGGLAAILSLIGSMLWAGAQYKAIISLTLSLQIFPPEFLEPLVALGLLTWSALGGLVADLWLDALSMLVVAPTMIALATMAWRQTSAEAFQAEQVHAWSVSPSLAANKFAVGLLGNLFTEELAGRVLTAESPGRAKLACSIASLLFGFIGLSPAILGVWAKSQGILQMEGHNLCDESQDQVIGLAVSRLLPEGELFGKEQSILVAILILESLNTVDTSILMCGKVMANQARRLQMFDRSWADHAAIVLALSMIIGVSKLGDNVWELAEWATAAVGAPLALLCILIPLRRIDGAAAGLSAMFAQLAFFLNYTEDGMPFLFAISIGGISYIALLSMGL
eukprot:symbB.v1.2.005984.t1/scaffold276.1/size251734/6